MCNKEELLGPWTSFSAALDRQVSKECRQCMSAVNGTAVLLMTNAAAEQLIWWSAI